MHPHELTTAAWPGSYLAGGDEPDVFLAAQPEDIPVVDSDTKELPPVVLDLWGDAIARGWSVAADQARGAWRAKSADREAGMSYDPPGELGAGALSAFDTRRTLALTGIDAAEAVGLVRAFLGWPNSPSACGVAAVAAGLPVGGGGR